MHGGVNALGTSEPFQYALTEKGYIVQLLQDPEKFKG